MKVIKRDGRAVDYNKEKIAIAIEKANQEVREKERATKQEIKEIVKYIEELHKKRMLVEDIQDIIEEQLMDRKRFELAKQYIVYRYTRALVRKQNTTDQSILGLIRNENKAIQEGTNGKNTMIASNQRDYIAGEVSKDLTNRILLPEKIVKAHQEGIIHFHNAEYFVQPIFNSSIIDIGNMLDNGTVINGKKIESPKSFQVACIVMTQIIAIVASNQYGGQSIYVKHLGKYLRRSYEKYKKEMKEKYKEKLDNSIIEEIVNNRVREELKSGVQTIQYQINTLMTANGPSPLVTLFLNIDEKDEYLKENTMIIEEILKQRYEGLKNEEGEETTPIFPKLVYVLDENNCLKGGKYDYLTKLAIKSSIKRESPSYISAKKMKKNYSGNIFSPMGDTDFLTPFKDEEGKYKFEGRFNQGVVSINLPQIGIIADGEEKKFWELLDERLEICKEALMCRHYALLGTKTDISPIHWQHGAISRLQKGEKIDKLLYGGYSTMSLGYVGIYETTKLVKGESHTNPEGKEFAKKIIKHLKEATEQWTKEANIKFVLYEPQDDGVCYKFSQIDKEKYGEITDITDKGHYTTTYHINPNEQIDEYEKLLFEKEFQELSIGGTISNIGITDRENKTEEIEKYIRFIYENIQYAKFYNK